MYKLIIVLVAISLVATTYGVPPPTTCKQNEVYLPQGVAPNCDTVCSQLGERCNVQYIQAPFGCYCVEGYARDSQNVCIPIKKCPPKA